MSSNPLVSIVTPSYNQAWFLEATILSVLNQDYPRIEYIIIDGGSADESVEIIRKYQDRLAYWVSEPDRGQGHAINKGFARATGEIFAWLNSDDMYTANAVTTAVQWILAHPDVALVYGDCLIIDETGTTRGLVPWTEDFDLHRLVYSHDFVPQPAAFFRADAFRAVGGIDESLYNCLDYDLWIRLAQRYPVQRIPATLAAMRLYAEAKTARATERRWQENFDLVRKYGDGTVSQQRWGFYHVDHATFAWQQRNRHKALIHLLQAFRCNPTLLRQRWIRVLFLKCLVGPRLVDTLKAFRRRTTG